MSTFTQRGLKWRFLVPLFILGAFATWAVQLGGVASLQAACASDLHVPEHDVNDIRTLLGQTRATLGAAAPQPTISGAQLAGAMAPVLQSLSKMIYRSSSVFTITPDHKCSEYYRYMWLNAALQAFAILLLLLALVSGWLHRARMGICSLLLLCVILAVENAHTFFHVREYAPPLTLKRGMVFFVGCLGVIISNMLLIFTLGTDCDGDHEAHSFRPSGSGRGSKAQSVAESV